MLDYFIIFCYLVGVFCIALFYGRRASNDLTAKSHYLAGSKLKVSETLFSIIATEVSALTFLGIPAFAFNGNFSFLLIYCGAILGRFFIARFFLPQIYGKGITVFSVIANGENEGQRWISLFYTFSKIFSIGVRLYSGSILVAQFLGFDIFSTLLILTIITFGYTLIGGLGAVVKTDTLQMFLFIGGGIIAHILIPQHAQMSWNEMMTFAWDSGKITLAHDFSSFLVGILGGVLFDMSTHGVDQDFVQRLLANKNLKNAQTAIFASSFLSCLVGLIFLGVGALLWVYYQNNPLPAHIDNADHLFAYYIVTYFPSGIKGLMVAGIMAATMSTLDSTINALCSCFYNDIFTHRSSKNLKRDFLKDAIWVSLLIFLVAVLSAHSKEILLLGIKIQSWTAGPLLAFFFSRVLLKKYFKYRFNFINICIGYLGGSAAVALNTFYLEWNWNFNVYLGFFATLIVLYLSEKVIDQSSFQSQQE